MPYIHGKYTPGDRPVECDDCGYTWNFSDMRKGVAGKQKGLNICPDCFDSVHPLDNIPKMRPAQPLRKVGE